MCANPEIQKSLWLDFSLQRLLLAPIGIGLAVYLGYLTSAKNGGEIAYYLALFFIYVLGVKHASECVLEEVNNATWAIARGKARSPRVGPARKEVPWPLEHFAEG